MASIAEEEDFEDYLSDFSQCSFSWDGEVSEKRQKMNNKSSQCVNNSNVVNNIFYRQMYGRFTKNPRAKTERLFNSIHSKCRFALSSLIKDPETLNHIFMGFTMCGQYFLSYTEKMYEELGPLNYNTSYEYDLYLWRFIPGQPLKFVSKHRIFKHLRGSEVLDKIMLMQFPMDSHKIVCYGLVATNPELVYISILTLPSPRSCKHCKGSLSQQDESVHQGWCIKHGFIIHYMFSLSQPSPSFDPNISLAFPNHLVINTGHYIHILNVSTSEPPATNIVLPALIKEDDIKLNSRPSSRNFNDALSEASESASEHFESSSIVDAILEDFRKSYHNTLVQNIVDPRLKRLQNSSKDYLFSVPQNSTQKPSEKSKIDKKIAEKAYEFIEENEKCEKLSSFRKKRLAEKKYEFSEDNTENIVPFNSLRRERSPRSQSMRSPMQSPNSRNGQFSPSGARNLYCTSLRNSPHHSKSPISPKDARKFYVYSPSLDSDCSDSDSRLILRTSNNIATSQSIENRFTHNGLLIVDPKTESPKWIKKVVRRYSNGDFENSSLVSGQSRDDYNIPIEIPLLVQNLTEQHLDVVPEFKVDQVTEMQLIVTQRSFDCEQFVQRRAQKLCSDAHMEFLHCEDYDIRIIHICPIEGHIVCQAVIKIGALTNMEPSAKPETFTARFLFSWSIVTDAFEVLESREYNKLYPSREYHEESPNFDVPKPNCKEVLVMDYCYTASKTCLRDYNNFYEICMGTPKVAIVRSRIFVLEEYSSDSD